MNQELLYALKEEGVKESVIAVLEDEELDTVAVLDSPLVREEMLNRLKIKGGQIARIQIALQKLKKISSSALNKQNLESPSTLETISDCFSPPSTPLELSRPSTPSNSTPSTPSSITPEMTVPSPPPNTPSSAKSFAIKEKLTKSTNWIKDFHLPEVFPKAVSEGLEAGFLSGNLRNQFTKVICVAIMVHTIHPSPQERRRVVSMILDKYSFLEDSLGAGFNSWEKALSNWFKNARRKPRDAPQTPKRPRENEECLQIKAAKKRCTEAQPDFPEGETRETCEEHIKVLQKEMKRTTNRDQEIIKDIMETTYAYRRGSIMESGMCIEEVFGKYPALTLVSELKAEIGRIFDDKAAVKNAASAFRNIQGKVLSFAAKSSNKKVLALLKDMTRALDSSADKADIECTTTALALQILLKERQTTRDNLFFKVCSENESFEETLQAATYPCIIGCGEVGDLDPCVIAAEGKTIVKLGSTPKPMAIALLVGLFYIFNIQYTPGVGNLYALLEHTMYSKSSMALKRISVQIFISDTGI